MSDFILVKLRYAYYDRYTSENTKIDNFYLIKEFYPCPGEPSYKDGKVILIDVLSYKQFTIEHGHYTLETFLDSMCVKHITC